MRVAAAPARSATTAATVRGAEEPEARADHEQGGDDEETDGDHQAGAALTTTSGRTGHLCLL